MKKRFVVPALVLGTLCFSARIEARDRTEDVRKMIQTASSMLFDRSASDDQIRNALLQLLDAAVLALPPSEYGGDARSNLQAVRAELKEHFVLSEEGHQHLTAAYRALNSGKSFQFPEVHSIEEAKARIQDRIAASVAALKNGQAGLTSRLLLECVIMVVTPIPR